jgi:predicted transposase YbfD/YdcC
MLVSYLSEIKDPRMEKKCLHKLSDILLLGIMTFLSNGEDYEDMVLFGKRHGNNLGAYLTLANGVPSHDTFNRVFKMLNPSVLEDLLKAYGKELVETLSDKQICLDGKKLKGVSPRSRGVEGYYIVSAWISSEKLCIGQSKVEDKSNEITAIPKVLSQLDLTGAVVSIDAIGTQKEIATQIIEKQGDYLLAVKKNQKSLYEELELAFSNSSCTDQKEVWDYGHGRYEERWCTILPAKEHLLNEVLQNWTSLTTLIQIKAKRYINNQVEDSIRYYISSLSDRDQSYFNQAVRNHWSIENQLHWHLDVTFNEDASRVRSGFAPENLNTLRKIALQLVSSKADNLSLKKRRFKASLDFDYLISFF